MKEDLKWIKKHYSEKMMYLCRDYLPTLLEEKGLLPRLLDENFSHSKNLADDIINSNKQDKFKEFMCSRINGNKEKNDTDKNPFDLMKEAGYKLYRCYTHDEVNFFKRFYRKDEEICTFKYIDERLENYDVFFAVKENVNEIKSSDKPLRQDEYGTSVICLQFKRGDINYLSIKNRYNHFVINPDATFSNNLDNIIKGLTKSFENEFGYTFDKTSIDFELDKYIYDHVTKKYYKCNIELNDICYCTDNVVIKNTSITKYDKEKYLLVETYLINFQTKKLTNLVDLLTGDYAIEKVFNNIEKINIINKGNKKYIYISNYGEKIPSTIVINSDNQIISMDLPNTTYLGNYFLAANTTLEHINIPNVKHIDDGFLFSNTDLTEIVMPSCVYVGNGYLFTNAILKSFSAPLLTYIGEKFLDYNTSLEIFEIPSIEVIKEEFLKHNENYKAKDFYFKMKKNKIKKLIKK